MKEMLGGKHEMKAKRWLSLILACMLIVSSASATLNVSAEPEMLYNGYVMDMDDLPKVHFPDHPEWEELYDATWQIHKGNIAKIPAACNPEEPYYIDEAFSGNIYAWDTLFMMMFDKWGLNQFPTLSCMDNFYWHQNDEPGEGNGYIPREISEQTGRDTWGSYTDVRSMNPPLWGWAEWEQYQVHGDVSRFSKVINGKTIFERLVAHYNFIERYKKMPNGLYGKTNGYSNGLDNTFNQGDPNRGNDNYSGDQTYNDLSMQQAQFAYYISLIAGAMGNTEQKIFFESEHARISNLISELLWDENEKMFSNLDRNGVRTNISTPTNLWALAGRVATEKQAEAIILNHGQNSQKLYRPYGLATGAYDDPRYKPEGGYWQGAFWAPTSFQYIKGLSEYGYDALAFEEAMRHLTSVSGVFQEGKKGGYVTQSNLWENYSSEYLRNGHGGTGANSRANFVGWTGCLSVGVLIEDIIGIDMNAPANTITWDVRLPEEHGISNLYMKHEGQVNRVSLNAAKRISSKDPVAFTVEAQKPFTLVVKNGAASQTYQVEAGTHSYTLGTGAGNTPRVGVRVIPLADADPAVLSKAAIENAKDYVLFDSTPDASIKNGLQQQVRKGGNLIQNVNTIGFAANSAGNPIAVRGSAAVQALGFADAQEVVKNPHGYGSEGFMFTVPANNTLQTVFALVGVENGAASITASLSDDSSPVAKVNLTGGAQESVYLVEIPYRASDDMYRVFVKFTHTGSTGKISLKGIALQDGGIPAAPRLTLESLNAGIKINAQAPVGESYDSYKVYYGTNSNQLDQTVPANAMPYTLGGLNNDQRYYVSVSGIKNGVEGERSPVIAEIPEEITKGKEERARLDLESALPAILNGNLEDSALYPYTIVSEGPIYGSAITFSSDTDGQEFGVWNSGDVEPAINKIVTSKITITSIYADAKVEKVLDVSILPTNMLGSYVMDSTQSHFLDNVYLTREGTKDWFQIRRTPDGVAQQAKKAGVSSLSNPRMVTDAAPSAPGGLITDTGYTYVHTNAAGSPAPAPSNNRGYQFQGVGNYVTFDLPYSKSPQRVTVYGGVRSATARMEFVVNGKVQSFEEFSNANKSQTRVRFDYQLELPEDQASVRLLLTKGSAAYLSAVTLQEINSSLAIFPIASPVIPPEESNATVSFSNSTSNRLNLTTEGTYDWFQLQADSETNFSRKLNGTGLGPIQRNHTAVPNGEKGRVTDAPIYYAASDADPDFPNPIDRSGMQCRGVGNGFQFAIEPTAQPKQLKVYTGNWNAKGLLEYVVNGEVVYSFESGNSGMGAYCTSLYIDLEPGDVAFFRQTLTSMTAYENSYGSTFIFGATLGDFVEIPDRGVSIPATQFAAKNVGQDPNIENSSPDGKNIGGIAAGSFLTYNLDIRKAGAYDLALEYAAQSANNPGLTILLDGEPIATVGSITPTGGWQSWSTKIVPVELPVGQHTLRLNYAKAGTNLKTLTFISKTKPNGLTLTTDYDAKTVQVSGKMLDYAGQDITLTVTSPADPEGTSLIALPASVADDGTINAALTLPENHKIQEGFYSLKINGDEGLERFRFDYVSLKRLTLNQSELSMMVGTANTLTATVSPADATDPTVTWNVAPEGVVTLKNGVLEAVSVGTATVTVTSNDNPDLEESCVVTVTPPEDPKYRVTVNAGDVIAVPITVENADKLSGMRGKIQYDDELLTLQSITAKSGFTLVSEDSTFVMVTPGGASIDGTVVIGYAVFAAKADLLDDIATYVIFPQDTLTFTNESGDPTQATVPALEVTIIGIPPLRGDVNLDGAVDLVDAIMLMQYLAGSRELSARQLKAADVNKDGKVNVGDVTIIMQMCL